MGKFKTVRRVVMVACTDCWGTGRAGGGKCESCKGKGEVETIVNEIVADEEGAQAFDKRG